MQPSDSGESPRRTCEIPRQSEERIMLSVESIKDYAILILGTVARVIASNLGPERVKDCEAKEQIGFISRSDRGRPPAEYST